MGTGSVIRPDDVQRMSAGTGVTHSEFNPSKTELVHFLQIWIEPERRGIAPSYEQKSLSRESKLGRLRLVASRDGREDSVVVHADASVYAGVLELGQSCDVSLRPGRGAWIQVLRGHVNVQGRDLAAGDGASFTDESRLRVEGVEGGGEALVFDLA